MTQATGQERDEHHCAHFIHTVSSNGGQRWGCRASEATGASGPSLVKIARSLCLPLFVCCDRGVTAVAGTRMSGAVRDVPAGRSTDAASPRRPNAVMLGSAAAAATATPTTRATVTVVFEGERFDVTEFVETHPGGRDLLLAWDGRDVTDLLSGRDVEAAEGHAHSKYAVKLLRKFPRISPAPGTPATHAAPDVSDALGTAKDAEFLTLGKPLLLQMWRGNFSKAHYLEQIHIPRHYAPGSAPIFASPVLELLTKTPWWVIPLIWLPVVVVLFRASTASYGPLAAVGFTVAGVALWTLLEYCIHRFLFHLETLLPDHQAAFTAHFLLHGIHHYLPMDRLRLVMPPALSGFLAVCLWSAFRLFLPLSIVQALGAGVILGYTLYDLCHYYLHHGKALGEYARTMKRYHVNHHYKANNEGFGITSKFWDHVFNTVLYA